VGKTVSIETPVRPEPAQVEGRQSTLVAPVLILVVVTTIVFDVLVYKRTEPDPPSGYASLPSWTLVAIVVVLGLAGLCVLAWKEARAKVLAVPFVVVMVVVTVLATWLSLTSVRGPSVPGAIEQVPSPAATRMATQALATAKQHGACVVVHRDPTRLLPTPYQRCAYSGIAGDAQVTYTVGWNGGAGYGFVFSPGATNPGGANTCVKHLEGPWWASMAEGDPARPCPFSFQFEEGP
jgi:hypothetical protein